MKLTAAHFTNLQWCKAKMDQSLKLVTKDAVFNAQLYTVCNGLWPSYTGNCAVNSSVHAFPNHIIKKDKKPA